MAADIQEVCEFDVKNQDGALEESYIYVKVLGRGAFGEANLYRKTEDKSLVVWKEVNLARLGEKERRDSQGEVDILSLLNHANIITYYNHFLDGETLLIEMEYANGGSLYSKVAHQKDVFPEELASALSHIHDCGIIHRDVKTLNVFMTKSDLLKLGDFGISRVLESESKMADSVVGTPYYMSPEIVQGAKYNYKTDIWALGCILYELLTLKRVFQATNQLRLAYEIVKSDYEDISPQYSQNIRNLVNSTLQKESQNRPTADEILSSPIFTCDNSHEEMKTRVWELNTLSRRLRLQSSMSTETVPIIKSKTSEVYQWGGGKFTPLKQDMFTKGKSAVQVAAGSSHFAVVTMEKELYTWANVQGGTEIVGQLGQGNKSAYKAPKKVESFIGAGFIYVSCGEDFTMAVTDEGKVYACGSDYYGCLGIDNAEGDEVLSPVPIDFFNSRPVAEISCGDNHCVALTKEGDVYTWGCGEFGRLGLNSEDDYSLPQKVKTPGKHLIKHVIGGSDGTFLITTTGRVLACGSNQDNKLGLNSEMSGLRKRKQSYDIPCKYTFSTVKPLVRYNIVSIATSNTHSAAIDMFGHLLTFGSNKYGQLGVGDCKKRLVVCKIGGELTGKKVLNAACGDGFTVAATNDNLVYSWGNGENGRLGAKYDGKGPNNMCTAYPRPVFGSLHDVPNLAARHWHTIIIAEKVLNQKTIRGRMSSPSFVLHSPIITEEDSAFVEGGSDLSTVEMLDSDTAKDSGQPKSQEIFSEVSVLPATTATADNIPDWLRAELDEAEVIPVPVSHQPPFIPPLNLTNSTRKSSDKNSSHQAQPPTTTVNGKTKFQPATVSDISHSQSKEVSSQSSVESRSSQPVPVIGSTAVNTGTHTTEVCLTGDFQQEQNQNERCKDESKVTVDVSQLLERVSLLETENKELRDLVKYQSDRIAELETETSTVS